MIIFSIIAVLIFVSIFEPNAARVESVNYSGHKVIRATPETKSHIELLLQLRDDHNMDLWNEPTGLNSSVMMTLRPELSDTVFKKLKNSNVPFVTAFHDLQSIIDEEKKVMFTGVRKNMRIFDFGKYNSLSEIENRLIYLSSKYSNIVKLEEAGQSYENRTIYNVRITSGAQFDTKPAIMMECGIHAREWTAMATCIYIVNQLITQYGSDSMVTNLINQYEFNIVPVVNPDGYVYSQTVDRMWRKTRSVSKVRWVRGEECKGADANRNFDINHCGVGTSKNPCADIYCGDEPFSESEARALRDIMINVGRRIKAFFAIHAFSQLWLTPYGTTEKLPPNYGDLERIGKIGINAIKKRHGKKFEFGTIANVIYEASGSTVDYAYVKQGINVSYALELRDTGLFGFFLPPSQILLACEETYDGLTAAVQAL